MIAQLTRPVSIPLLRAPEAKDPHPTLLHNITWEQLEQLDFIIEHTGMRLTYIDGIVEIMAPPSEAHESPKGTVRRIIEVFLSEYSRSEERRVGKEC